LYINKYPKECNNLDLILPPITDEYGYMSFYFIKDIFSFKNNIFENPLYNIKNKKVFLSDDELFSSSLEKLKNKTLNIQSLINIEEDEDVYILLYYALLKLNFNLNFYKGDIIEKFEDKFTNKICGIPVNKFVDTVDNLLELEEKHSIEF
jgi:hypothetical protein